MACCVITYSTARLTVSCEAEYKVYEEAADCETVSVRGGVYRGMRLTESGGLGVGDVWC